MSSEMHHVTVFETTEALIRAAAHEFTELARAAIAARGRFSVALAGGSTPRGLYALLATPEFATAINWAGVHVFWGDERCVPPDHADSNYRMARETLLDAVPLPPANVHRMQGEREPVQAAADYERELCAFFDSESVGPGCQSRFDLALLGMGADGHTASLFPHSAALKDDGRLVAANYVDSLDAWRITLTVRAINAAAKVMILVAGVDKAERLRSVLDGPHRPYEQPVQFIQPTDGTLRWFVDNAARHGNSDE